MSGCNKCKHYAALQTPRKISESAYVYGFCFKNTANDYGRTYPVYIPNGACSDFAKKKEGKEDYEYEENQEFKCDCCKKNMISKMKKIIEGA